jgi:nucleoside-diphosphate-sugar epimerase
MKILITGGCGYVGGYLTDVLLEAGHDVTVYDNLLFEDRFLKDVNFINGDIRDKEKLGAMINDYDVVIWLAAMVGDGACQVNPKLTEELNFDSVKWLVDNYKGKILFPSTCSVYGVNNDLIDETAPPNPLSAYASTKLAAEQYIVNNHDDYLIFRLGTLYGLGDRHSRLRLDLVANILTKRAVEGETLSVFGGQQWRPLLHVKDVGLAFLYGLENNIQGLFNLSEKNFNISNIANIISDTIPGVKVELKDMNFEDLRNYRVNNNKILDTGWKPKYQLEDGIKELKKVFEDKRVKNPNDPVYSNAAFVKLLHK